MTVMIYQPIPSATQAGNPAENLQWMLEYVNADEARSQIKLKFHNKDDAIAYAKDQQLEYEIIESQKRTVKPKSYSDNFTV